MVWLFEGIFDKVALRYGKGEVFQYIRDKDGHIRRMRAELPKSVQKEIARLDRLNELSQT